MVRFHRLSLALLLALAPHAARAQVVTPGSSGATTSTTTVESLSNSSSTTLTFSRDQTFVISGSNVDINGTLTVPGLPLGGVTAVEVTPASVAFPSLSFSGEASASSSSSSASREQITITASDAASVQGLVLNPELNATVRDDDRDFDLAVTQSTPGLSQAQRSDTTTTTTQTTSSLSVFTAPFVP
ncbi:MAG: hypothetical protein VKM92_03905 [Cyanobacteriota bacterium]|nr:hypothetical protein [Cyanobacteriota bacterium]